jgi:4,5:9,10-diseco-3-hydroxy-5,9,17-trioxoandrosta-1(10),2-diene-4-oate hydrolase
VSITISEEVATGKYADLGDMTIHYGDVGEGEPVVLLHGGGPGASAWSNFKGNVQPLVDAGFRVIPIDMPGFGRSTKVSPESNYISFLADGVSRTLDQLGIDRARFIGNSMGGQTSIKLAIDRPELVHSQVVIGSTPVDYSLMVPMPAEGVRMMAEYYSGTGPTLEKMRAILATLLYNKSLLTEELVKERYEASMDPELLTMTAPTAIPPQSLRHELHKVLAPTMLVWGAEDRAGALDIGLLMLRAFANADMHIFSKCGHWAQVERRDEFNQLTVDFFNRVTW